jgi:predicted membrane channel-forming protein YqfA (hemolysin III family)
MADLITNANPKHNPITTGIGIVLLIISALLFIVPYFVKLEQPVAWWAPIIPFGLGLLGVFMNDETFNKILNRADKVAAKKTGTDQ